MSACAAEPEPEMTFPADIGFSDSAAGKADWFGSVDFERRRQDLADTYPTIEEGSFEPENDKVLCPFLRLLDRAGMFYHDEQEPLKASIFEVAMAAQDFGCSLFSCGSVASAVSAGQIVSGTSSVTKVNLTSLHTATGVAHDCGFTFAKGGTVVDPYVRQRTLDALGDLADDEGRLSYADLRTVKQSICDQQDVPLSFAGSIEVGLIYTFLGGNEQGYIDHDDVVRFFHAELPKTIGTPGLVSN